MAVPERGTKPEIIENGVMAKRKLISGDRVEFVGHDANCLPCKKQGTIQIYIYPHFHPSGYVEVVDDEGNLILYGNAAGIKKIKP